jgi:hypothetical protein
MKIEQTFFKSLSEIAGQLMHRRQMSIYSSKFSKREFTRHQLLTLLLTKTYLRVGYRRFCDMLPDTSIPKLLHLRKLPHFTTLQKFASRQLIQEREEFLFASAQLAKKPCQHMAIDATGMSLRNASKHYELRIGQLIRKRDFLKVALMADLDNQLVYAVKMRLKTRSDHKDFVPLWNKIKNLPFKWFFMDKGYDSDRNHRLIYQANKKSFGCVREKTEQRHRMKGKFRRRAKEEAWQIKKRWRSLIETINSVVKRMFDKVIYAKNMHTMKVEMYFKLIMYNFYRLITYNLVKNIFLALYFMSYFWHWMMPKSYFYQSE